jgi:lysozyme
VAISILVLALVAGLFWFAWLPHYRPALNPRERYGIDVSHHQGPIDWRQVAGDGISFVYIKATEGGDFIDPRFQKNWEGAGEAGLDRGAYHFFTLCTSGDDQARNYLRTVPENGADLPPALDLELSGNSSARPRRATVLREISEFLRLVESATDRTVLLYIGDDFDETYSVRTSLGRPLWHLRFLLRPDVPDWVIWQVMGYAQVEGVKGRVDLDVMRRGALRNNG